MNQEKKEEILASLGTPNSTATAFKELYIYYENLRKEEAQIEHVLGKLIRQLIEDGSKEGLEKAGEMMATVLRSN